MTATRSIKLDAEVLPVVTAAPRVTPSDVEPQAEKVLARNWSSLDQWHDYIINMDQVGILDYQRMVRTDETVSAGIEFITLTAMARLGDYYHPTSKRITKFIRKALRRIKGGWKKALRQIIRTSQVAGFSVTEKVWTDDIDSPGEKPGWSESFEGEDHSGSAQTEEVWAEDSDSADSESDDSAPTVDRIRWWIYKLITLNPLDVVFRLYLDNSLKHGEVKEAIQHYGCGGSEKEAVISRAKIILLSHNEEFQDPFGRSRLGPAWKNWYLKDVLLKSWGGALRRYAGPIAVAETTDTENSLLGSLHAGKSRGEVILAMLQKLSGGGALVLQPGEKVMFQELASSIGKDFEGCIGYLNRMILRALLIPMLVLESSDGGSDALGEKHWEFFLGTMESLLDEVEQVLIEDLIKPLVAYNFGIQESYGCFTRVPIEPSNLEILCNAFYSLTNNGYMTPAMDKDLDFVRKKVGLTNVSPEEIEAATKRRAETLAPPGLDPNADPGSPGMGKGEVGQKGGDPGQKSPGVEKNGERSKGGGAAKPRPVSKVPTQKTGGKNPKGNKAAKRRAA